MSNTTRINEIAYETMQSIRNAHGITLDNIAAASRRYGARWTPGFLSGLKRNRSSATLENLIILCACLTDLTGEKVTLADLFAGDGPVDIGDDAHTDRHGVRDAVSGRTCRIEGPSVLETVTAALVDESLPQLMRDLSDRIVNLAAERYGARSRTHVPTLSEIRLAKRLGVTPAAAAAACMLEYGDHLDEVTAHMAGEDATPQLRGRKTREVSDRLDLLLDGIAETGEPPARWTGTGDASDNGREVSAQWIADHLDQFDYAAKYGDTEAEQEAYEDMP
ncbi:hypothetical protein [Bifidobacterium castoris]|uniref:Uncharacterized protein n=1 Tax=Bifidobacterium castoris TaxID=2306972 RepID=A0A430F7S8_9BIFI|nr:hypothetical protein [Bifidobacterium castoris]RSX48906.1 hypothetical protein D2E22_1044 [Bifidobacterium castoris]